MSASTANVLLSGASILWALRFAYVWIRLQALLAKLEREHELQARERRRCWAAKDQDGAALASARIQAAHDRSMDALAHVRGVRWFIWPTVPTEKL